MKQLTFVVNEQVIDLQVEPDGEGWLVHLPDGTNHSLIAIRTADDSVRLQLSDPNTDVKRILDVPFSRILNGIEIAYRGEAYTFSPAVHNPIPPRRTHASGSLSAPMAGVIAEVLVTEGQNVRAHDPLIVVEAMKVMATVEAPFGGTVTKVYVRKNDRVGHGDPVIDIRSLESTQPVS